MFGRIEQFIITDHNLKDRTFEDFASALRHAMSIATKDEMVTITMPDGRRFTILETTSAVNRRR